MSSEKRVDDFKMERAVFGTTTWGVQACDHTRHLSTPEAMVSEVLTRIALDVIGPLGAVELRDRVLC